MDRNPRKRNIGEAKINITIAYFLLFVLEEKLFLIVDPRTLVSMSL